MSVAALQTELAGILELADPMTALDLRNHSAHVPGVLGQTFTGTASETALAAQTRATLADQEILVCTEALQNGQRALLAYVEML
ncbi:hypothetical protein [Actinoalloteichus hymeniacidonis]|uniref:Uncharacterized protein n=1 Tax=Actinoalloteichus hymeniacidonis TaxID=340345 RepID=A0AAC9HSV8_9PSEU|nr:hypothetical protein [Actinoalloteichus hymeniacidonis]AOS64750.1 hypothetical protein TL08_19795 [Actinoalloteichus hymeniacidonis]MBB5907174.1 hypothetical protein [Actinoalloteichus hymeniacidonis]